MDERFFKAASLLPSRLRDELFCLPDDLTAETTEIRVRVDTPPSLRVRGRTHRLLNIPAVSAKEMEELFLHLCRGAVYAHADEIAAGFVTAPGGIRVGLCGRAVTKNGVITSVTDLSAFNIRIARQHAGAAAPLLPLLSDGNGIRTALLFGPPLSGKTTLLRDLASSFASRGVSVAAVDERRELFDRSAFCLDVLSGYPRKQGIEQAVRLFSPELIVFDELGSEEDVSCLTLAAGTGAAVITTAHAADFKSLCSRRLLSDAVKGGFFSRFVRLSAGEHPGRITEIYDGEGKRLESGGADNGHGGISSAGTAEGKPMYAESAFACTPLHLSSHGA